MSRETKPYLLSLSLYKESYQSCFSSAKENLNHNELHGTWESICGSVDSSAQVCDNRQQFLFTGGSRLRTISTNDGRTLGKHFHAPVSVIRAKSNCTKARLLTADGLNTKVSRSVQTSCSSRAVAKFCADLKCVMLGDNKWTTCTCHFEKNSAIKRANDWTGHALKPHTILGPNSYTAFFLDAECRSCKNDSCMTGSVKIDHRWQNVRLTLSSRDDRTTSVSKDVSTNRSAETKASSRIRQSRRYKHKKVELIAQDVCAEDNDVVRMQMPDECDRVLDEEMYHRCPREMLCWSSSETLQIPRDTSAGGTIHGDPVLWIVQTCMWIAHLVLIVAKLVFGIR